MEKDSVIVIISNGLVKDLPEDIADKVKEYGSLKVFNTSTGIFRYSPVVSVYLRD
jgi:hypothetical protein